MILYENIKTIGELIKASGEEHGKKVFLRWEENGLVSDVSYKEFANSCEAVKSWLLSSKADTVHKIGVLGTGSFSYLSFLFGVMASGNIAVPLDIQANEKNLCELIAKGDIDIILYENKYADSVNAIKKSCPLLKETLSFDILDGIINKYGKTPIPYEVSPKDCAMILFTSGTTGAHKGVMLSHENLIDNTFCTTDEGHPENEIYMNVLPAHHIYCLNGDFLLAIRYGNILCLNKDISKLEAHIRLFSPTVIRMVPMMAKSLYNRFSVLQGQNPEASAEELKNRVYGKNLKKIVSGGGYLASELAKCYQDIGILIAQGYGMSECSPKIASPDWSRPDKVHTVGKIVDRCEVRIEDGEIQVKSPSVMMGYYKDEQATEQAFTRDGWLKTGDLGFVDDEGYLCFTGRSKNLIVLSNGENIAPEQLENMFDSEVLIEDILVFGENDRIQAEVFPNLQYVKEKGISDIEKEVNELISKKNGELPSYKKILGVTLRFAPFEKTSSRKIIRDLYMKERSKRNETDKAFKQPENEIQKIIFSLAAECLGHSNFGTDTSLFEAGLDSLGSVLLLSALYDRLTLTITLQELTEINTVEKLEEYMKNVKANDVDYSKRDIYPLTSLQMYFGYVMRGHTIANIPFLIKLSDKIDILKLKKAVEKVFDIHPELKALIKPDENGMLYNSRCDERAIDFPITELSDKEWENIRDKLVIPFMYMGDENLFHGSIYKTESANYLFFDLAHISGDGYSMNLILEEINAVYLGKEITTNPYTFYEYIIDEGIMREGEIFINDVIYYSELDYGLKTSKSILNRKDCSSLEKGINSIYDRRLSRIKRDEIRSFCKMLSISENALFLSAYALTSGIFSNSNDVITTSIHNGRVDSRWNKLIGSLFVTYHFRSRKTDDLKIKDYLTSSAKQILKTMDHKIPALHADEVIFQYQGDMFKLDSFCGEKAERISLTVDSLPFHMQVFSDSDGYNCNIHYWANRYDENTVELFTDCYEAVIDTLLHGEDISEIYRALPLYLFPENTVITADALNKELGKTLFENEEALIRVFVLDETLYKKPYMAWGELYTDTEPSEYIVKINNPFGDGYLYKTAFTARISTDGTLDELNSCGRIIMIDSETGTAFVDLRLTEKVAESFDGVTEAHAYAYYFPEKNGMMIGLDIKGITESEPESLKSYLAENLPVSHIPNNFIICD